MKRSTVFSIVLLLAVLPTIAYLTPRPAQAAGGLWNTSLTASASGANADGSSAITFTVHAYYYICSVLNSGGTQEVSLDPNYCAANGYGTATEKGQNITGSLIVATGSGNTLSATTLTTDSSGYGTFTLKSTVAEAKTVSITTPPGSLLASKSVTFVNPAPSTPSTSTNKQTTTTTTTPTTPKETAPPEAPKLAIVKVDDQEADTSKEISVKQSKPLVLSGTTVPNATVTLTIHSTPRTATVKADDKGNWTYTVTGLEVGDHHVMAAVTDPTTNKTSEAAQLLAFTVTSDPKSAPVNNAASASASNKSPSVLLISVIAAIAIAMMAGGWFAWRYTHKKPPTVPTPPTPGL